MLKKYLECGKVVNKRGIKGELKVECYCDSVDAIDGAKKLYADESGTDCHDVISIKNYKGYLYILLDDIRSAEEADSFRGKSLYADRDDIRHSNDKVFVEDILGLEVKDADTGKVYGKLCEIFNSGASDIYRIVDGKNEYLIPAVPEIVISADPDDCILVRPISGMFDTAEEIK